MEIQTMTQIQTVKKVKRKIRKSNNKRKILTIRKKTSNKKFQVKMKIILVRKRKIEDLMQMGYGLKLLLKKDLLFAKRMKTFLRK